MMEAEAETLDELIEGITSSAYGMPVRLMERARAMGLRLRTEIQALLPGEGVRAHGPGSRRVTLWWRKVTTTWPS